jgi:hypothetical protein
LLEYIEDLKMMELSKSSTKKMVFMKKRWFLNKKVRSFFINGEQQITTNNPSINLPLLKATP